MPECIFCAIARHESPATILYEDDEVLAFPDIRPKAKIHIVVVPKIHVASLAETNSGQRDLLGHCLEVVASIARAQHLDRGYKTVINTGPDGGQVIDHLHIHLLAGEPISGPV